MKLSEKQLIGQIRKLRQVKPTNEWVFLTKTQILGEEPTGFSFYPYLKPALTGLIVVFVILGGLYGFVKNSLPGDTLYSIKKIVHEGQAVFVSEAEKPAFQLKLANDRLNDLTKAPAENLAPTINEFQANISQAAREIAKIDATTSNPVAIKKIVEQTQKLEKNKQKVESLGVVVEGTEKLDNALGKVVENLIDDLKGRSLTKNKEKVLNKMEELFGEGKYSQALEFYLINQ
jgi:hypothetical protein